MKTQKKLLSLVIGALLTVGIAAVSTTSYAERKNSNPNSDSDKRSVSDSGVETHQKMTICHVPPGNPANAHTIHISSTAWPAHDRNHPGDYVGSCKREVTKIKETLVSTNPPKRVQNTVAVAESTLAPEKTHVITGCASAYSSPLRAVLREYYEPAIVPDTALDDPTVAMAVSNCLDNGDSSDSSSGKNGADSSNARDANGNKTGGKGQAHVITVDSVSDSGNHRRKTHYISNCQNKNAAAPNFSHYKTNDSHFSTPSYYSGHKADSHSVALNPNYRLDLKDTMEAYMTLPDGTTRSSKVSTTKYRVDAKVSAEGRRGTVVSDSAMDDDAVMAAVKACAKKSQSEAIDSSKIGKKKGANGHQYHVVKSCGATLDAALNDAIDAYEAKASSKPLVIPQSALNDAEIKAMYDDCLDPSKGSGSETVSTVLTNVTINNANIAGATITDRTITGSMVTTGGTTIGAQVTGTPNAPLVTTGATVLGIGTSSQQVIGGTTVGGNVSTSYTITTGSGQGLGQGNATTVTAQTIEGNIIGGTITGGTIASGTVASGTSTSGELSGAVITSGTFSGGTVTGGTIVDATVSGGTATATSGSTVITTGGEVTGGVITGGTTTGTGSNSVTTGATVTGGTVTGGTTTGLTITGGTASNVTQAGATITGATVTGATAMPVMGASGNLNWREVNQ